MLLESNKIYRRIIYAPIRLMCPSLEIKGTATLYVSNSATKPSSIDEMEEIDLDSNTIHSILGQTRWIAVSYDEDTEVYEMGLVESPFKAGSLAYSPEIAIDDQGTILLAGPDWYLYW